MSDDDPRMLVMWCITTPRPTPTGGATITNGVTTSTSGFDWPKLEKTLSAVLAQFEASVRETIDDELKLEVWVKIDAMPRMQREGAG
jgi:hypothetical protein